MGAVQPAHYVLCHKALLPRCRALSIFARYQACLRPLTLDGTGLRLSAGQQRAGQRHEEQGAHSAGEGGQSARSRGERVVRRMSGARWLGNDGCLPRLVPPASAPAAMQVASHLVQVTDRTLGAEMRKRRGVWGERWAGGGERVLGSDRSRSGAVVWRVGRD